MSTKPHGHIGGLCFLHSHTIFLHYLAIYLGNIVKKEIITMNWGIKPITVYMTNNRWQLHLHAWHISDIAWECKKLYMITQKKNSPQGLRNHPHDNSVFLQRKKLLFFSLMILKTVWNHWCSCRFFHSCPFSLFSPKNKTSGFVTSYFFLCFILTLCAEKCKNKGNCWSFSPPSGDLWVFTIFVRKLHNLFFIFLHKQEKTSRVVYTGFQSWVTILVIEINFNQY